VCHSWHIPVSQSQRTWAGTHFEVYQERCIGAPGHRSAQACARFLRGPVRSSGSLRCSALWSDVDRIARLRRARSGTSEGFGDREGINDGDAEVRRTALGLYIIARLEDQATAALRIRNGVTKLSFSAHVITPVFCNGPLISQHFRRPVTPKVAGFSPVAPASNINHLGPIGYPELERVELGLFGLLSFFSAPNPAASLARRRHNGDRP
jgi:hypothetical protein